MDKKILVVDDAMFMRSIIRKILKEAGYTQVWEAQDGEKAMELFREVSPDLVLLDITMPGRSGLEVLEEVCPLSARMIVNPVSMRMESGRIKSLLAQLRSQLD